MPHAEIPALFIMQNLQRANDLIEIVQGLSHAHINQILDRTLGLFYLVDLVNDFGRRQVTLELQPSGGAKAASHTAADLGGQAEGNAAFVDKADSFYALAIGKAEQIFCGAVRICLSFQNRQGGDMISGFCQLGEKRFRYGRDLVQIGCVLLMDKRKKVISKICLLLETGNNFRQFGSGVIF